MAGGLTRNRLAVFSAYDGGVGSWNPNANGEVYALALSGNTLYAGGAFTTVGGQPQNRLSAIDLQSGIPSYKNFSISGQVYALAVSGNTLYAGGTFYSIDGQVRPRLASIDLTFNRPTAWQPALDYEVKALTLYNGILYAGGHFKTIAARSITSVAAFGRATPQSNYVRGTVFEDANGDCTRNPGEKAVPNAVLVAEPGNYYGCTDSAGNYSIAVDTGSYAVRQIIPADKFKLTRQQCPAGGTAHAIRFTSYGNTLTGKDFGNVTAFRTHLTVHVSSTRRRRCAPGYTTLTYANVGNMPSDGVKIYLKLPEYVVLTGASAAYTVNEANQHVFSVGSLPANASGTLVIRDSVVCNKSSIRGLTQCTKAWITPANVVDPPEGWDGADVTLEGACAQNGTVRLVLRNAGTGSMADSAGFRVYLDAQIAFLGRYKLTRGDSLVLKVPAHGRTVRLEADQRPDHPRSTLRHVTLEACGTNANRAVSKGFVTLLPQLEPEPEVDMQCLPILDSFDPNDKSVFPQGVTQQKFTPTGSELNYVIRFQNTGTDVAYKVVVVDTLSDQLDIRTLRMGGTSHACRLAISGRGKPVLTWTFQDINLPDSAADQARSNGYIRFSISPKGNLPLKAKVQNYADIFFDYNEAIRTNATLNTLYDVPPVVAEAVRLGQEVVCNPANRTVNAGPDRTVCGQDTLVLGAVSPGYGKGRWRCVSGAGVIAVQTQPDALITGLAYGVNVFEWSIPFTACDPDSLRARVTITRLRKPATPAVTQVDATHLECSVEASDYEWHFEGKPLADRARTVAVSRAGRYTVRVKNADGCFSEYATAYGYQLPCYPTNTTAYAGASRAVCEQDSVRLQAGAPLFGSGNWRRVGGSGTIQDAGNPTSVVSELAYGENTFAWSAPANTCNTDSVSARVTITRMRKSMTPSIALLGTDSLTCTLAAGVYHWYLDGRPLEATTRTIRALQEGNYVVRAAAPLECTSDASPAFRYLINGAESPLQKSIRIYPNPSSGKFVVLLPTGVLQGAQITIYNALGKPIAARQASSKAGEKAEAFDLVHAGEGMYLIKIQTQTGVMSKKVVIAGSR